MRILFFVHNVSKTRHFERVLEQLAERGHTIVLAAARQQNRPLHLPKYLALANRRLITRGRPGRIEMTACPVHRVDAWEHVAPALRHARDHLRFCDPRYAHAAKLERRSAANTPKGWAQLLEAHPRITRHWQLVSRALALAEDALPSEKLFDLFIAYERPDLVLVTPLVDYGSYQTDYVKSAHRLGVPVVFVPFSWDNLTNRGLIRVEPDRVLVWNDFQQREAVELHGVSPDRVVVTGAPRFDEFFAMKPSTTREAFCARCGLDPAAPVLLYLCSSEFVAPGEAAFVERWIARLREAASEDVRRCGILVRPHPAHVKPWRDVDLSRFPNVALWAEKESMNSDRGLYDSLFHSAAVVGLNTSAMIEAGILGKPVFTLVTEEFAGGQEETLHFHYLRASNGGLLHEASTFEEHIGQLSAALEGESATARTQAFVERFVRPRGLAEDVSPVMVDEIERAARIEKRASRSRLWHYAVRAGIRAALPARRTARTRVRARAAAEEGSGVRGETLLLTATFRAETTPYLVIRDEDARIHQYMCALVSWARSRRVQRIVLGENSHTRFDFSKAIRHLEAAGKEVEILVFDGNKEAGRLGKGFGEGEILEHLYRNSQLLRRGDAFYKITGRIFVRNFDRLSASTAGRDAFRLKERKGGKLSKANTVFFKCSRDLFESRLLDAYTQVDEPKGVYIEHIYFNRLHDVDTGDFGETPVLVGQQASTGKMYEPYGEDVVRAARELMM